MITIQSGKLLIPEEERFVGFAGDNLSYEKQFVLLDGDVSGSFELCLRFDDDSVRVIPLEKHNIDGTTRLRWTISASHLLKSGVVMAQLRSTDSEGVIGHTSCDYFVVANSAELDGDGEISYVSREELEERMTAFLIRIRDNAPYIGDDGYWYVYDVESDSFVRSVKASGDITIDDAVIANSPNPPKGGAVKTYVDTALAGKVDKTRTVAGLPLSANISQQELAANLSGYINPKLVIPGTTSGIGGQYGKTADEEPVMCVFGASWVKLMTEDDAAEKMSLAPDVTTSQIAGVPTGQVFTCQANVALKTAGSYIELAKRSNVYSRSEIDSMIGNIETLLSTV